MVSLLIISFLEKVHGPGMGRKCTQKICYKALKCNKFVRWVGTLGGDRDHCVGFFYEI